MDTREAATWYASPTPQQEFSMTGGCFARHRKTIERAVEAVCFRLVARRVLNAADAVDFKQEMLLHVLAHENILDSFAGRSTLTTYLFKVIERFGLRWCARRARQRGRLDLVGDLSADIETSWDASRRVIAPSLDAGTSRMNAGIWSSGAWLGCTHPTGSCSI